MNISPQLRTSLSSLLEALQAGMDPSTGYGMYNDALAQRDAQQAQRQQERAALTDQLLGFASSGAPLSSAETYLSSLSASGAVRPQLAERVGQALPTMYGRPYLSDLGNPIPSENVYSPLAPPPAPPEVDPDAEFAAALPTIQDIITRAAATQSAPQQKMAAARQVIMSDPQLTMFYVQNQDIIDQMIEQAAVAQLAV